MFAQPPLWFIIIAFLCAIGPLVFFHELGHYWVARWFGVGAEQFSIGFGREIAGWTDKRGTRWKVGWLPLGGYVRFVGDMNPASQPGHDADIPQEVRAISFHHKPWWQRFLIVLAGPLANFLLAIVIFAAFFMAYEMPNTPPVADGIAAGSAADRAGLRKGDRILAVGERDIDSFEDLRRTVAIRPDADVLIKYEREGEAREVGVRLGKETRKDEFGQAYVVGLLGLEPPPPRLERLSAVEAVPAGVRATANMTRLIVEIIGQIVTGERSAREVGGPLRMAQVAGQRASLGWPDFVYLIAAFSINLGFINLLPVPMLDGGHLVFYVAEGIRRRPVSERAQDWAFRGGLALLLALLLFTTVNDLASFGLFERLGRLIG
ncbi:MAG: M50 family metallopeptidase [Pseudomonadota bacterium]|nr:M50 family metallopeptidase [Pseudomonadota bacterium]